MSAPLTPQMLIDAITLPGVSPVGTPNPDLFNPRYGESSAGQHSGRRAPGTVETSSGGKIAAGFGPWIEVSSMNRTKVDAKLDLIGHLYSLSKSGKWTERIAWGIGAGSWAAHLFSWGIEHGTCQDGPAHGWGSKDQSGVSFGDNDGDPQGGGQGFVRVHGWPNSWTGLNGFFWTSTDPNSDHAPADPAKLADLAAIVATVEVAVSGTQASQARYAISHGWDTYWQGANVTNPTIGTRTGSASGFREVRNGSLVVCSTLSRAQIAATPPTIYPGWQGATVPPVVTPPPPPPPVVTDTLHLVQTRTTTELLVDGKVVGSASVTSTGLKV